jgi:hypothetical protein
VQSWITAVGAKTAYIEPGSLWENSYIESFNALRYKSEIFYPLLEAGSHREVASPIQLNQAACLARLQTDIRDLRPCAHRVVGCARRPATPASWRNGHRQTNIQPGPLNEGRSVGALRRPAGAMAEAPSALAPTFTASPLLPLLCHSRVTRSRNAKRASAFKLDRGSLGDRDTKAGTELR